MTTSIPDDQHRDGRCILAETARRRRRMDHDHPSTSGSRCPTPRWACCWRPINASIVLISLPAIFRGIGLNPLAPGNVSYLLWMLMGYLVVTAVLVVPFGRLGDMFGRVRIYNLGFVVFTLAAVALSFDPFHLGGGALWLIGWRVIQGIGGAMLMASSSAILTDAFPAESARHGARRQHGRRRRRVVPGSADRRLPVRVALEGHLLGRRADRHRSAPSGASGRCASSACRHAGPAGLAGHADLRRRADGTARRHHLRHPAVRRLHHRMDQPVGAGVDRRRSGAAGGVLLHRTARRVTDGRHPAVPVRVVRHGQSGRADVLDGPRRPAVHAHHLAAGHLASVARLQLRVHAAVGGHLPAARSRSASWWPARSQARCPTASARGRSRSAACC